MIACPNCGEDIEYYGDKNNIFTLDGFGRVIQLKNSDNQRYVINSCKTCELIISCNFNFNI
ncbi:MAG: hypothetical protein PHT02_00880 [Tissierellia bacterium]|nr:hypothetical protein [Tissierellia bacterium]